MAVGAAGRRVAWNGRGATSEGHEVALLATVGDAPGAVAAAGLGAQGVGLFGTEPAFGSAAEEPSPERQRAVYEAVLGPFAGAPVTVRTLDAGAGQPFLALPDEPNPALGVRGLRVARVPGAGAGVLDRQLAALAAAAHATGVQLKVMAPMVSTAEEAAWFTARCRSHGIPSAGVMIEVPAAVLTAREILAEVDVACVGTDDLAQYVFAADRRSGVVAALHDPWQPALLRLLRLLGDAATAAGTPVGVCGAAAADPVLAPVLVGLGMATLSMGARSLAGVGAALATATLVDCCERAAVACAAPTPAAARAAVTGLAAKQAGTRA